MLSPWQEVTAFGYDLTGKKTVEVLPGNYDPAVEIKNTPNRIEYVYDSMGRVKLKKILGFEKKYDPALQQWQDVPVNTVQTAYKYDLNGNKIKELDAVGYLSPDPDGQLGLTIDQKIDQGYGTEYSYDMANRIEKVVKPETKLLGVDEYTKKYSYDTLGRVIGETSIQGAEFTNTSSIGNLYYSKAKYVYDHSFKSKTIWIKKDIALDVSVDPYVAMGSEKYDDIGNVIEKTDGNGNKTLYTYNALNQLRQVEYPGDMGLTDGDTIHGSAMYCQYDAAGNRKIQWTETSDTEAASAKERFTYDLQGRPLSHAIESVDTQESISTYAAYDVRGNKRYETDGEGNQTEYIYDALNRLQTTKKAFTNQDGVQVIHENENVYDENGNVMQRKTRVTVGSQTVESVREYAYDAMKRLYEETDEKGNIVQRLEYDPNHRQKNSYDAEGHLTTFEYDRNNRVTKKQYPLCQEQLPGNGGTVTRQVQEVIGYDKAGNIAFKEDGRQNKVKYIYNELKQLIEVIQTVNGTEIYTYYTYDKNGNMLTQKDGGAKQITFAYNPANKVKQRTDQGGLSDPAKQVHYTYYPDGKLKYMKDRNGAETTYTYYYFGSLQSQTTTQTGKQTQTISYTYDANLNQKTMVDSTGTTERWYDPLSRVIKKQVPHITVDSGITEYTYDIIVTRADMETGCIAETAEYPSEGTTVTKTTKVFDATGKLKYVLDGDIATTDKTEYTYYPDGSRESVMYANGAKETYTYYADNLLKELKNYKPGDTNPMDVYQYNYDNAGNQIYKTEIINGQSKGTTAYEYDELNRLEKVTEPNGAKITEYTFDRSGNRKTQTITEGPNVTLNGYYYNEQNRLMQMGRYENGSLVQTLVYSYDNNGNQTSMTVDGQVTVQNTYDVLNRLETTISQGNTATYAYNGEGYRVEKTVGTQTTKYLYEYDKVILEFNGLNQQTARNIYGLNLLTRIADGQTLTYMYNGHADVTALLDPQGQVVASYYYDAFGNILEQTGTQQNPYRYAGYQYDEESGWYYLNARMYDPVTARFLQEDTYRGAMDDPLSLNLYTYCHNEPIMYWDPTGHAGEPVVHARIGHSTKEGKIINDRTYLGLRDIGESLGGEVDWENGEDMSVATISLNDNKLEIITDKKMGTRTVILNGEETSDIDIKLVDGRNVIPLRAVANSLGIENNKIDWYRDDEGVGVALVNPMGLGAKDSISREVLLRSANAVVGVDNFYTIDDAGFLSKNTGNITIAKSATAEALINKAINGNYNIEVLVDEDNPEGTYYMSKAAAYHYPINKETDLTDYDAPLDQRNTILGFKKGGLNSLLNIETPKSTDQVNYDHINFEDFGVVFVHELTHSLDFTNGADKQYELDTELNMNVMGMPFSEYRFFTEATAIWVENSIRQELRRTDFRYDGSSRFVFGQKPGKDEYGKFPDSFTTPNSAIDYINTTYYSKK